jgi:hypothetical protein
MRKNKTNTTWPGVHKTNKRNNKNKINYRERRRAHVSKLNAANKITPINNNILNRFVNSALD